MFYYLCIHKYNFKTSIMNNKTKLAIVKIQMFVIKMLIAFLTMVSIFAIFGAIALMILNF